MNFTQTIESDKLVDIFDLPRAFLGRQVEVIIRPLLEVSGEKSKMSRAEVFGCMRGQFKMSDDFDAPLDDFAEYM